MYCWAFIARTPTSIVCPLRSGPLGCRMRIFRREHLQTPRRRHVPCGSSVLACMLHHHLSSIVFTYSHLCIPSPILNIQSVWFCVLDFRHQVRHRLGNAAWYVCILIFYHVEVMLFFMWQHMVVTWVWSDRYMHTCIIHNGHTLGNFLEYLVGLFACTKL